MHCWACFVRAGAEPIPHRAADHRYAGLTSRCAHTKDPTIAELLKNYGYINGQFGKNHLGDLNQYLPTVRGLLPLLTGAVPPGQGPRQEIYYFSADGDLNAVRWGKWKINFTSMYGNLTTAYQNHAQSWPIITNLRLDPYERFQDQSLMYLHWFGKRMFLIAPAQALVAKELESLKEFPPARGSSLSLGKLLDKITYANPVQ